MRLLSAVLLFLLVASSGNSGVAANEFAVKEMEDARKIYVAKCAKCHRFYDPKNYTVAEWQRWMESMSRKSKLKPEQERLLGKYLDSYRAGLLTIPK